MLLAVVIQEKVFKGKDYDGRLGYTHLFGERNQDKEQRARLVRLLFDDLLDGNKWMSNLENDFEKL